MILVGSDSNFGRGPAEATALSFADLYKSVACWNGVLPLLCLCHPPIP